MNVYPLEISTQDDLKKICARIQTDPRAFAYLSPKSKMLHFYAENIDYRAAAFLKQELLSRGGDTIVTKHVIDGKAENSSVLLMGTHKQIKSLIEKLHSMDCWGLKDFREKLSASFKNIHIREWKIISPAGHEIILSDDTKLMAIMNLTPDSFFAESRTDEKNILGRAENFLKDGAYILDVGAESTRPGAKKVSESEEISRLIPALKILRKEFPGAIISIDTYKPEVARISANEGADIINDISGFEFSDGMPEMISRLKIPYVLSHIKGTPENMANHAPYENIIDEIIKYFSEKLSRLDKNFVIIDPGIGFGKDSGENFAVLKNIDSLKIFGRPLLVGHSRKRFTGTENISGTLAVSAMMSGKVSLLRVHEVKENARALEIAKKIQSSGL